jgi:hypothetical protein
VVALVDPYSIDFSFEGIIYGVDFRKSPHWLVGVRGFLDPNKVIFLMKKCGAPHPTTLVFLFFFCIFSKFFSF